MIRVFRGAVAAAMLLAMQNCLLALAQTDKTDALKRKRQLE